jgi:hypothetical protein
LMTFLSSALSKRIFSPYSTAELSLHLPTKFATVSQNLSECFYDFRFATCGYDFFFVRRYENRSIYLGRAPIRLVWYSPRSFPLEGSLHFDTVVLYFLRMSRDLYLQRPMK